jgi:trehalose synthase
LRVELLKNFRLDDYADIVGPEEIASVRTLAETLKGKSVAQVNSTSFGGGVAEILHSMVPLMADVGLTVHWEVIQGTMDFFKVTKKIHNALQGMPIHLSDTEIAIYQEYTRINSEAIPLDEDFVLIHDNQPAALIEHCQNRRNKWIWRCHVDLSTPNLAVWNFLERYISRYDAAIFTAADYIMPGLKVLKIEISPPSINPLTDKNKDLPDSAIQEILKKHGVSSERPIITQVGRFDPWKDPLGAINVYRQVKKEIPDTQLLLIAGMATDDPEGWLYFEKAARHAGEDCDIHLLTDLKGVGDIEVNAFQRASDVALQLSTREGFGLTVTEALWKGVPVVARKVGGIPLQIVNGINGFLVDNLNQAIEKTIYLLKHKEEAKQMGSNGREHVRKNFLIIRHIKDELRLFAELL